MNTDDMKYSVGYIEALLKWLVMALLIGAVCGGAGAAFAHSINFVTAIRLQNTWLIYLLPVGGPVIAGLYRLARLPVNIGTDRIFEAARRRERAPFIMAPLIFASTVMTHLLGGSAGREGAALQLGGCLASSAAVIFKPKNDDIRIIEMCGMAAVFSALFGTPVTAALFVMEVMDVGVIDYRAMLPCTISSVCAGYISKMLGVSPEVFPLAAGLSGMGAGELVRALILGVMCAVVAVAFCKVMHFSSKIMGRAFKNDFVRACAGGAIIAIVVGVTGVYDYCGGGMDVIARALSGSARYWDFAVKMLFTAVTLSAGFKGGEIVPSFFVGATFGCAAGGLLGLDPSLGAALGLAAVFCGVTNTPAASLVLCIEMFGAGYLPMFAVTLAASFMLSGHISIYHSQEFYREKLGHEMAHLIHLHRHAAHREITSADEREGH